MRSLENHLVLTFIPSLTRLDRRAIARLTEKEVWHLLTRLKCGEVKVKDRGVLAGFKSEFDHSLEYEIDGSNARIQSYTHVAPDDEEARNRYLENAIRDTLRLRKWIRDGQESEDV